MRRAVFFDRDGILNQVVLRGGGAGGGVVIGSPRALAEFTLTEGAAEVVSRLRRAGYLIFVVTNQPDIERGLLDPAELESMSAILREKVGVDEVVVCPHDDAAGCRCRKPKPGMLEELAARWGVDLGASYMVGDSWRDVEAGRAAGCVTVLLRRPYNEGVAADIVVPDLEAVAGHLVAEVREMGERTFTERYLAEARQILDRLDVLAVEAMAEALAELRDRGGRLFFLGVGGGAAHASHAVNDFRKLAGFEAYAPVDNVSELTARTNDEGWDTTFESYLRGSRLGPADGVFVFSVGGGSLERGISANIVRALQYAQRVGAAIFGVVGRDGGYTAQVADHCVVVPTVEAERVTPHTESFQAVIWHLLVTHPRLLRHGMKWETVAEAPAPVAAEPGRV